MDENLVNRFHDGLHLDNDPNAQPPNTYRDSLNGTIITLGGNRFAWETLNGNLFSFSIPVHAALPAFQPIGWCSFPDNAAIAGPISPFAPVQAPPLLVLSANESNGYPGEIGYVVFDNSGSGTYTPLYYHVGLQFSKQWPVMHDQIVGRTENQNIKRLVWTDNYNPLRSMNWADARFTTQIASGSLVGGQQYMVLTNAGSSYVTYNDGSGSKNWGPGQTAGNIFTAANTGDTFTVTGTAWVIAYVDLISLQVQPTFAPGSINLLGIGVGNLPAACYQYAYQLETSNGSLTNWSYLSLPVHVITTVTPSGQAISYANYTNVTAGTNTHKSVRLSIDNIDNLAYSQIRVAFVASTAEGVYGPPTVFLQLGITGTSIIFSHFGGETPIQILTLDDLTTPYQSLDLVRTITSTKNYLFAANIGIAPDPIFPAAFQSTISIRPRQYLLPSDFNSGYLLDNQATIAQGVAKFCHGAVADTSGVGNTSAAPLQWYVVLGTYGVDSVTYNGTTYPAITGNPSPSSSYFQGIYNPSSFAITQTGSGQAIAIIRIQKYTGTYNYIQVQNDFTDFKGVMASHYLKSRWRRETYRAGFFVYGTKGSPNYVQWLGDVAIPQQWVTISSGNDPDGVGFGMRLAEYYNPGGGASDSEILRTIGLDFSNIDFNQIATAYGVSLANLNTVITGFSIVFAPLQQQIQSQGILYPNMLNTATSPTDYISPQGFDDFEDDVYYNGGVATLGRVTHSYMYYSPDTLDGESGTGSSGYDGRPNVAQGDFLELTDQYSPYATAFRGINDNSSVDNNYFNKFYSQYAGAIDTSGTDLYKKGAVAGLVPSACVQIPPSLSSPTGIPIPGLFTPFLNTTNDSGNSQPTYGGQGLHVYTSPSETVSVYPLGIGGVTGNNFSKVRSIVNWIRPIANLYGGTSAAALAATQYIFAGHYQALDSSFMTYMVGTSGGKLSGIVNNVEVYGGDCFVCNFGFARLSCANTSPASSFSNACVIPIESNVNENWRGAWNGSNSGTWNCIRNYNSATANVGIAQEKNEDFTFHALFTGKEDEYFFSARPLGFVGISRDPHLEIWSDPKTDGEIIDSWKIFPVNNFIVIDGQYGDIVNIRGRGTRLFTWQQSGITHIPIEEQQMNVTTVGVPVQMGIGGVAQRFDEIDFWYGNQHQGGLLESEEAFLWFDFKRKALLRLSYAGAKAELSLVKGTESYFENAFTNDESILTGPGTPSIFSSSSFVQQDNNFMLGYGILGYYDQRLKIGFMCFKLTSPLPAQGGPVKYVDLSFTMMFNRALDKFMGFTSFSPAHMILHNGFLLASRQNLLTIQGLTTYNVADQLYDSTTNSNYVCILSYTSISSPVVPSSDTTHWTSVGSIANIYTSWRGQICQFFGVVYPAWLTVIVKDDQMDKITVDSVEVSGNNVPFTSIEASNSYQFASDENIQPWNKEYRYFDGSWWFTIPFNNANGSRLVESWMQLKLVVQNYATNPSVAINSVKRMFYIKGSTRKRK